LEGEEMKFNWTYENEEARCEWGKFVLFASRNRCFVMQGGIEVASEQTETLMEGVLFCENYILKRGIS
jgi:hypothetical protein